MIFLLIEKYLKDSSIEVTKVNNSLRVKLLNSTGYFYADMALSDEHLVTVSELPYTLEYAGKSSGYGEKGILTLNTRLNSAWLATQDNKLILKSTQPERDLTKYTLLRDLAYFVKAHAYICYKIENGVMGKRE
ncbi:MAG: hypothetical protein KME47_09565 [Nodosilinea sp. WJT8-NPBG4]|jgi:hypothetical protein|nr:hypothetical protein [Nodosilinea sp. WJT8-NPBG4]